MSHERARELLQEAIHEAGGPKKVAAAGLACMAAVVLAAGAYSRSCDEGPGAEVVTASVAGDAAAAGGKGQTRAGSGSTASAPPAGAAVEEASGAARTLLVHVAGAVRRPGLVRLETRARVADAIRAAGGAAAGADVSALNLAALVADAEKVYVPKRGEAQAQAVAGGSGAAGPSAGSAGQPVDLNTAGAAELDALPGIGPVLAQRIVDYRASNGRFASVDDLRQVEGIGPKKFEQLKPLLVVH